MIQIPWVGHRAFWCMATPPTYTKIHSKMLLTCHITYIYIYRYAWKSLPKGIVQIQIVASKQLSAAAN